MVSAVGVFQLLERLEAGGEGRGGEVVLEESAGKEVVDLGCHFLKFL